MYILNLRILFGDYSHLVLSNYYVLVNFAYCLQIEARFSHSSGFVDI